MAELSIIIVSYNNLEVIKECLESIKKHNDLGDKLQIIVVEQSPQNQIYDYIKSAFPEVVLVRNENKGFGGGNNVGEERAEAPILLFLNPDTVLVEPVCAYAVNKFKDNPELGLFGVQLLDGEHKKSSSFMMKFPYGIWNKTIYKICNKLGRFDSRRMYIQGADMFVRRDAFHQSGRFDEEIFMYCEETDLCTRIGKAGYQIEFDPSKQIVHLEGKSTDAKYATVFGKQIESFRYICAKHGFPFETYIRREYRDQKIKLWIYKVFKREKVKTQRQLLDVISAYM